MACINAVRSSLWASRGRKLLGDITYIDVLPTYGKRGIWGYHPLVDEMLFLVNVRGIRHSGSSGHDLVQPHAKRICVRGDTDSNDSTS